MFALANYTSHFPLSHNTKVVLKGLKSYFSVSFVPCVMQSYINTLFSAKDTTVLVVFVFSLHSSRGLEMLGDHLENVMSQTFKHQRI